MTGAKNLHPENYFIATVITYAVLPLSGFATDVYLPSFPNMASQLGVAEHNIQFTLSLYLISFGLSQIFTGLLLDVFGRYKISLAALLLFSGSCIIIAVAGNIWIIYMMRIIQGICTAFTVVVCRAFFSDIYEGERKKHYLSLMTIVWSAGPIVAPFVGGYLEHIFGWRSNFYFLAIYGVLLFILQLIFFGETVRKRIPLNVASIGASYKTLFHANDFIFGIVLLGVSYAMIMLFSLSGPFIIEHRMGYSPIVMGYVSLILGFAWMCGGFISKGLIRTNFLVKIQVAFGVQLLLIVLMIFTSYIITNIFTLVLLAFLIHVTAGFIFNNYFTYCLSRFPHIAGVAGGVTGGLAYTLTSILSYGSVAIVKPISQATVGVGYSAIAIAGIAVMWFSRRMYLAK
jgi:multidrug resistance protein